MSIHLLANLDLAADIVCLMPIGRDLQRMTGGRDRIVITHFTQVFEAEDLFRIEITGSIQMGSPWRGDTMKAFLALC